MMKRKRPLKSLQCCLLLAAVWNHNDVSAVGLSPPAVQPQSSKPNLLILGLGMVGSEVAFVAKEHFNVYGTVRRKNDIADGSFEDQRSTLKNGVKTIPFDSDTILESIIPKCSHVLVTIPPPKPPENKDALILTQLYDNIVKLLPESSWIGIISSTGVYGHHEGNWVDESSDLRCQEGTTASLFRDLENEWQARILQQQQQQQQRHCNHILHIFRCAGIYGPDRSALHTLYKRGMPSKLQRSVQVSYSRNNKTIAGITNRIHVTDLARAVVASMMNTSTTSSHDSIRIYNLADDLPESREVVMTFAAELLESINITIPEQDPTQSPTNSSPLQGRAKRRSTELKRVSNKRMKLELLPKDGLVYPTYVEGLQGILSIPGRPWSPSSSPTGRNQ